MKDLILQFIDEKLDGNIENLSNYDLLQLIKQTLIIQKIKDKLY